MLATDNHLLTTNEHLQATDKRSVANKLDINKRLDNVTARMDDTNAVLKQIMSSFDKFMRQRHHSRSRS
jgi:hypothetical protein